MLFDWYGYWYNYNGGFDIMRIIDKQHDFYDYLQDSTDTIVFDRRGSFLLTKEDLRTYLNYVTFRRDDYRFLLLQCGGTFWLFLVTILKKSQSDIVLDYDLKELISWKNYDKPNELLKLDLISFRMYRSTYKNIDENVIKVFKNAIDHNDFRVEYTLSDYKSDKQNKRLPLLKACGIGNIVDTTLMFCAIEEYFSIEKTKAEKTVAEGTTNKDKITMHGFDIKESFRGKR